MDFTFKQYIQLLSIFKINNYNIISFKDYLTKNDTNISSNIILRHDIDKYPLNALRIAQIENVLDIKGSYYFRIVQESYNINIIKEIVSLGHEIGYHYEDVDLIYKKYKTKNNRLEKNKIIDLAYDSFCSNLNKIRQIAEIKTICMHGSPLSKFDNRIIWEKYNYKELNLIGEPYYDINYNKYAYLTDTGRRWNGDKVSVRDRVKSNYSFNFKYTQEIINNINIIPKHLIFTIHPQRWNDDIFKWIKEYITQNIKNIIKNKFYVNNSHLITSESTNKPQT